MAQLPIFPQTNIGYPVVRRPYFSTIVTTASSGLEVRIGNQIYPLSEWDLLFEWLQSQPLNQVWQTLYGFYVSNYGKFSTFLYDDKTDNTTSPDPLNPTPSIIVADGVSSTYQIGRCLPYGGVTGFEPLFDFKAPPVVTPTPASISPTGLMDFGGPLSVGTLIKMDFKYYWRVRFADDDLEFSNFGQFFWEAKKVTLRQARTTI
jgi:Conserved hypothetical protein 2217 (DUF2460)